MLNETNYFSKENNLKYMGSSQFKAFMECQAGALAEIKEEYKREKTVSMLVGSYVDAHFSKSLDLLKAQNSEIFTQKGTLKADFKKAEEIILRLERDEFFMSFMAGETQVIKTGSISGVPFKIKIDNYFKGDKIVDLKIMKDFKKQWKDGLPISFIEAWGYDFQAAIYQEVVCDETFERLPFYIAGATKEKEPDLAIIEIKQDRLDYCLDIVRQYAPIFAKIKTGEIEAERCGICDYCKSTKKLTQIINYEDVG